MLPPPLFIVLYLLLDHELVALHYLQLVPSGSVLPKLIHPTASKGAEQVVLVLSSRKQRLNLRVYQRKRAVSVSVVHRAISKRTTSGIRKKHKSVLVVDDELKVLHATS